MHFRIFIYFTVLLSFAVQPLLAALDMDRQAYENIYNNNKNYMTNYENSWANYKIPLNDDKVHPAELKAATDEKALTEVQNSHQALEMFGFKVTPEKKVNNAPKYSRIVVNQTLKKTISPPPQSLIPADCSDIKSRNFVPADHLWPSIDKFPPSWSSLGSVPPWRPKTHIVQDDSPKPICITPPRVPKLSSFYQLEEIAQEEYLGDVNNSIVPVSPKHIRAIHHLMAERLIKSRKVFDVMLKVDFEFFYAAASVGWIEFSVRILTNIADKINPHERVLMLWSNIYVAVCVALFLNESNDGVTGSVVTFGNRSHVQSIKDSGLGYLLEKKLLVVVLPDEKNFGRTFQDFKNFGHIELNPYSLIVGFMDKMDGECLKIQLSDFGRIYNPELQKVLYVRQPYDYETMEELDEAVANMPPHLLSIFEFLL